jgi:four helix bundle protein
MGSFRDLIVYRKAFTLAMEIFELSKAFPVEEKYSLTDQIRRSSRSVTICLAEAYRKRKYPAHFVSKVTDSDMENAETQGWLDYCLACKYITQDQYHDNIAKSEEVGRLLQDMIEHPEKYGAKE